MDVKNNQDSNSDRDRAYFFIIVFEFKQFILISDEKLIPWLKYSEVRVNG